MVSDSRRYDIAPLTFELDTTGNGRYLNNIFSQIHEDSHEGDCYDVLD